MVQAQDTSEAEIKKCPAEVFIVRNARYESSNSRLSIDSLAVCLRVYLYFRAGHFGGIGSGRSVAPGRELCHWRNRNRRNDLGRGARPAQSFGGLGGDAET